LFVALVRVLRFILLDQIRRADILLIALFADDVDQVGARQPEIAVVAQLHELLQMNASHALFLLRKVCLPATDLTAAGLLTRASSFLARGVSQGLLRVEQGRYGDI
jgi:hypothetical protein